MKGYIGCDADLEPGTEIVSGHHRELRLVVVGAVTEEQARESAEALGYPLLNVVPGERFYEVEITTLPVGGSN